MQISENLIRQMVKESIKKSISGESELNEALGTVAISGAAIAAIATLATKFYQKHKEGFIRQQFDKDIPRADARMREIARSLKMAKNSRDIETAEKKIEEFRATIEAALVSANKLEISDEQVKKLFGTERSKKAYKEGYITALKTFRAEFENAINSAYAYLDTLLQ